MDNIIRQQETEEGTVRIYQDLNAFDPRKEGEPLGQMICFSRRYTIGDEHSFTVESLEEFLGEEKPPVVIPLYLYDHSIQRLRAGENGNPFLGRAQHAEWDSGKIGYIFATKDAIKKEYGKVTKKTIETARKRLLAEVEEYDMYIAGEVYCYEVETKNGVTDSCGGIWGLDYAMEEGLKMLEALAEQERKAEKEQHTLNAL